jgi:hypothetical protein
VQLLQPLKAFWVKSWTHVLGYCQAVGSVLALGTHQIVNLVQDPNVKHALEALNLPYVALGLAVLAALTLASMEHNA